MCLLTISLSPTRFAYCDDLSHIPPNLLVFFNIFCNNYCFCWLKFVFLLWNVWLIMVNYSLLVIHFFIVFISCILLKLSFSHLKLVSKPRSCILIAGIKTDTTIGVEWRILKTQNKIDPRVQLGAFISVDIQGLIWILKDLLEVCEVQQHKTSFKLSECLPW